MIDRNALAMVAGIFILAAAIVAAGRQPEPVVQLQPPVLIISTPAPTGTPIVRVVYVVATPTEQPVYHAENAAPAPTPTIPVVPSPAPRPWVADPVIAHNADGSTVSTFEAPTDAPRLCTGFHDWRDYDAMYASSPACGQP